MDKKDGQKCEGMSAGFYTKTQTCGDIYASVRGSWAAVTFKSKSVPSLRVRLSKKVGLIGCPKMLPTNYQPTLSNIPENKVLNFTAVEGQNLAWVIRVKKWPANDFFHLCVTVE
jgi:hypothetical protein